MSTKTVKKEEEVIIRGNKVTAVTPEGLQTGMDLEQLIHIITRAHGRGLETGSVLPDGVKMVTSRGNVMIWVYERPPQVYSLKWIANDSPSSYGKGTTYRTVRIALPYLIVLAVFMPDKGRNVFLSQLNECFFRTSPLNSVDDELYYPALLNCSKFEQQEGRPLSWICTVNMNFKRLAEIDNYNHRTRESMRDLLHCLLETGYNRSSEHHEESSWFTESNSIDARISTVENWEKATAQDPLFVLDIPWLPTGRTTGQVIERIFELTNAEPPRTTSAEDIQRILLNHAG
jgi:hypothetical protein